MSTFTLNVVVTPPKMGEDIAAVQVKSKGKIILCRTYVDLENIIEFPVCVMADIPIYLCEE